MTCSLAITFSSIAQQGPSAEANCCVQQDCSSNAAAYLKRSYQIPFHNLTFRNAMPATYLLKWQALQKQDFFINLF